MRSALLLGVALAALSPAIAFAETDPNAPAAPAVPADSDTGPAAPGADQNNPKEIIVNAPFSAESATIVEKVDRDTILKNGGSSIADSLAEVPGIAATGFAAGASRPIVRGMDATRVRILEDGVSSADVSDIGPDHGVPIDPLSARSIEVIRGAAALRYGSQAIGGVVNATNNRVPTELPTKPYDLEFTGSYDTVSNAPAISGLTDIRAGNLALHADAFYRNTEDYDTPDGTQENSFFHGWGASGGASYFFGDSHVGASVTHYDAQYGIPSDETYIDMHQTKVTTRNSFDLGTGLFRTLNIDGGYADYQHSERDPDGTIETTFKNKEWNGRAEMLMGKIGPLENTSLGFEYGNRKFQALGADSSYLFPATSVSEAGFLFTELPIAETFRLQASGRVEHVHIEGTPSTDVFTKRDFTPVSGALSALFDATKSLRFGLTFSSTGRAPAMTELFARGGHDGPNTFETGDPTLKIERANSLEGTVRFNTDRFHFSGSIYSTWFNNYIYGDLTGRTCDDDGVCVEGDGEELKELNYAQQGAHFRGAEGEARYQLVKTDQGGLAVKALADYVRATLDDGSNVPRIPPYRVGGGLDWTSTQLDAGFLYMHVGKQDEFGAFDSATPGYDTLSAQIAWRPVQSMPGLEFAIVGKNLTNSIQRDAAALNRFDVVMPGRNIRFVVKIATF